MDTLSGVEGLRFAGSFEHYFFVTKRTYKMAYKNDKKVIKTARKRKVRGQLAVNNRGEKRIITGLNKSQKVSDDKITHRIKIRRPDEEE